ncbi:transglycosylase SLT domain-containing protein [Belnapia sp. T18]|uniref:Transglycosylase SLT domain-containing protein n=1 Tax=Belnapia arida TaxID=2804533 RepID=A0ABS1UDD4_9PROT|nr:transglycosylase SLT domain-containing protein [Belnapia arida]MBL6082530.1 transglycosylase SLT domain-containing protein [Belnapia arida]
MQVAVVHVAGAFPLDETEVIVQQQEEILGPLVDLGNAGTKTALTFDMDSEPPKTFAVLRLTPGGQAPVIPGFRLVCQGNCLVAGQLAGVAAFRAEEPATLGLAVKPSSALEHALMAQLPTTKTFHDLIAASAAAHKLPPAVIAAIGSVESAWGTSSLMIPNGPAGTGDRKPRQPKPPLRPGSMPTDGLGFGRGLMQIDWDAHDFARSGNWQDAGANIDFGAGVLAGALARFSKQKKFAADALRVAILAYNQGEGGATRSITEQGLEAATGPGTYAGKVLQRIPFFETNGFA